MKIKNILNLFKNRKKDKILTESDYRKNKAVTARGRYGYLMGYDDMNNGKEWDRPWLVRFGSAPMTEANWFATKDIKECSFGEYIDNPYGFGHWTDTQSIIIFGMIGIGSCIGATIDWNWLWMLMSLPVIILGHYGQYKGWSFRIKKKK